MITPIRPVLLPGQRQPQAHDCGFCPEKIHSDAELVSHWMNEHGMTYRQMEEELDRRENQERGDRMTK